MVFWLAEEFPEPDVGAEVRGTDRGGGHVEQLGDLDAFQPGGAQLNDLSLNVGKLSQRSLDATPFVGGNGRLLG